MVCWSSKKKNCVSISTVKSEYVAVSSCYAQVLWMRTQLTDYGFFYDKVPIYCDSKIAIAISCNPVQHTRTKHIDVRLLGLVRQCFSILASCYKVCIHMGRSYLTATDRLLDKFIGWKKTWLCLSHCLSFLQEADTIGFVSGCGPPENLHQWRMCGSLTAFHYSGYSLQITEAYAALRNDRNAEDTLSKLLQMGTVAEYESKFVILANRVMGISTILLKLFYISGLKPALQCALLMLNPTTLDEAFSLVRATKARITNLQILKILKSNPSTLGEAFFRARITDARVEDENSQAVDTIVGDQKDPDVKDKQELKSMFEKQAGVERFDLIQTFHVCKQKEEKSISSYVLKMKGYVEQVEHLGYVLPQDISVGLILNSLTSDFVDFVRNYNMHNMRKTIGESHALLIEYETGLPKKATTPQVLAIQGGRLQDSNKKLQNAKGNGKGKGKGNDKLVYTHKPKNLKPSAKEHPTKDDVCHHCKEVGHWKMNCLVYFAELMKKKKQVGIANSSGEYYLERESKIKKRGLLLWVSCEADTWGTG
uniref:Zinc finger, CCHC-type n=1 Tax=Tanacetum cinerariifolium TaxID=118510 RepID=A0A6L2NTC4_TANCI|nr:hypothetical protein [Tanacetum cinerariifolium]